jgi:hypothetical protein
MTKIIILLAFSFSSSLFANSECMIPNSPSSEYIAKNKEQIDLKNAVGDAKVVLIGDSHEKASIRKNLEKLLPQMKAAGMNCLALEFLKRNVNYDKATGPEMLKDMEQANGGSLKNYPLQSFVDLALAARKLGMKVIGINHTDEDLDKYSKTHTFRNPYDEHDELFAVDIKKATDHGDRVIVLAGLAHTGSLYEKTPSDNRHVAGELIYRGVPEKKIRSFILYTEDFYPESQPESLPESFVPLKRGLPPGCNPIEAKSMYDGVIFTKKPITKSEDIPSSSHTRN